MHSLKAVKGAGVALAIGSNGEPRAGSGYPRGAVGVAENSEGEGVAGSGQEEGVVGLKNCIDCLRLSPEVEVVEAKQNCFEEPDSGS